MHWKFPLDCVSHGLYVQQGTQSGLLCYACCIAFLLISAAGLHWWLADNVTYLQLRYMGSSSISMIGDHVERAAAGVS